MRLPFRPEELKSPRKAASRLGEQNAIQLYLTEVEPGFRNDPEPYPKDWAWRKFVLFTRSNGLCEECHKSARFDEVNAITRTAPGATAWTTWNCCMNGRATGGCVIRTRERRRKHQPQRRGRD